MARPVECMARLDPAIVDSELVGFFIAPYTTRRDGTCLRSRAARRSADWISREWSCPVEKNSLGNGLASRRLHSDDDAYCQRFPLEFSMAAAFPPCPCPLCRRSVRAVFAKTKTSHRLPDAPAPNPAHNRRFSLANRR